MTLTTNQRAALIRAHRNPPYVNVRKVTAQALIDKGYVYEWGLMRPMKGINVALTDKGKNGITLDDHRKVRHNDHMETFIIGSADAIEAEYGHIVDAAFGIITLFNGEICDVLPFATKEAAKAELAWVEDRSVISFL